MLNIFKVLFKITRKSYFKLKETIYIFNETHHFNSEKGETINSSITKTKDALANKIPIKTLDRDKEREEERKENNFDNLFIKGEIILEDPDNFTEKPNFLNENLSIIKEKHYSVPLPAKNNFIENKDNKYNKDVFKTKNNDELEKTYEKKNSFKQNKSYTIEKENEEVSPISGLIERKKYSTLMIMSNINEDNKNDQNKEIGNNLNNLRSLSNIIRRRSSEVSKSDNNIFVGEDTIKKENILDESLKTVKSETRSKV